MMRRFPVLITLVALLALGCGAHNYRGMEGDYAASTDAMTEEAYAPASETVSTSGVALGPNEKPLPNETGHRRKIIYTADVDLEVKEFDPIPERVEELVKQFDGFVASSNVSGSPGYARTGTWKLRIPAERHGDFLAAVRQLGGQVRRVRVDSKDVTEEFYDVEARIRNKKKAEERLIEHLEDTTSELQHILTVEQELSRVREEIERVEGRLRVLADLTSMSTFNLNVTEVIEYVPEEPPGYLTRVRTTFEASIDAVVFVAEEFSIAVVALSPWLGVLLVLLVVLWIVWRIVRPIVRRCCKKTYVKAELAGETPFGE